MTTAGWGSHFFVGPLFILDEDFRIATKLEEDFETATQLEEDFETATQLETETEG